MMAKRPTPRYGVEHGKATPFFPSFMEDQSGVTHLRSADNTCQTSVSTSAAFLLLFPEEDYLSEVTLSTPS